MSGDVTFELTAQDNVHAMRTHSGRLSGWLALLLFGVGNLLAAFNIHRRVDVLGDWKLWLVYGLCLVLLLWDFIGRDAVVHRQFRQGQAMNSPARMRWDEQSLAIDTDRSQARFEWPQFYRWMDSKTTLLLYRDAGFFFAIPRRAVGDKGIEEMIAALRAAGVKQR